MTKIFGFSIAIMAALLWVKLNTPKLDTGSAVEVLVEKGHGSGVHIGDGFILTAAHVVLNVPEGSFARVTRGNDYAIAPAKVVWKDKRQDLALLWLQADEIAMRDFPAAKVSCASTHIGQKLTIVGWPLNLGRVETAAHVLTGVRAYEDIAHTFIVHAPVVPGNSGGPAFDSDGKVAGIVVALIQDTSLTFVVPLTFVCPLLPRVAT